MRIATRLFTDQALAAGVDIILPAEQAHLLRNVLRLDPGAHVALFNARDGEWLARLDKLGKQNAIAVLVEQRRPPPPANPAAPWLVVAPVKRARMDTIIEKATELGVARILPVFTRFTNVARVNLDRLAAQAVEAAEQCERLDVPDIAPPSDLERVLADWPAERQILLCDEAGARERAVPPLVDLCADLVRQPLAVLIGPEGGFAPAELDLLRQVPFLTPVGLGPRILRADTAAIAALAILQAVAGDWRPTSAAD